MKNGIIVLILLLVSSFASANTRGLEKYVPQYSFIVIGADFAQLQGNEIFLSMQQKGQIWSYEDDDSEVGNYFRVLKIDPQKDLNGFVFSKYLNSYGNSGKLHVFALTREISGELKDKPNTSYLNSSLYRLDPDQERYVVLLTPTTVAVGNLNEVKMAVDLQRGKLANIAGNATLNAMFQKVPAQAGVWGLALPLARRKAAAANAKQSTNPLLSGLQSYYFYAVPTKKDANAHFYGQTEDERQASVMSAFMIGTLTVAKLRVDETLAEVLDQVNIEHSGNSIHVSAVVTKEMVDAYFKGKLGVD